MKATIGNNLLAKLTPKDKAYDVRDDKVTGFMVRVNVSGKLLYMCEYARGKRITIGKVGILTPAQARDRAIEILGEAVKGVDPMAEKKKPAGLTLQNFIEKQYQPWVETHRKDVERTLGRIKRCFVKPFGNKQLSEINPILIDQWRMQRLKIGRSIETVNRDIATFKAALSKAVLWGFVEKHPLDRFKLLRTDSVAKVRYFNRDEETKLRAALDNREKELRAARGRYNQWLLQRHLKLLPIISANHYADHLKPMVLLSINTGMRQGELFNIAWDNINFETRVITVEGKLAKSGKTRHIPLNDEAHQVLLKWRDTIGNKGLIFQNKEGESFYSVKKAWNNLLEAAGITNFRWHDMRHHFASRLVMAGVDLNTVRELLGHSDIKMTLRYAHLAPEHKAQAVAKLLFSNITNEDKIAVNG